MTLNRDGGGKAESRIELWSLREDVGVELAPGEDGPVRLRHRWGYVTIPRPPASMREALRRMCLGPISLENVVNGHPDGTASTMTPLETEGLSRALDQLQPLVVRSLGLDAGQPLLSVVPISPRSVFRPRPVPEHAFLRLSTYAQLRTDGREYLLESPLALHQVLLHRPEAFRLLGVLDRPVSVADAARAWPGQEAIILDALSYLVGAGMVVTGSPSDGPAAGPAVFDEDDDPALAGWSPVDLMFHTRSTLGRHDGIPSIDPATEGQSPDPVVRNRTGPVIALPRPRWEDIERADPPLTAVIEARRSVHDYAADPVSLAELGELLYRTARVRSLISAPAPGNKPGTEPSLSDRPYPGVGGCYELELYLTVSECDGLDPGTYHYDPLGHRLERLGSDPGAVEEVLRCTRIAMGVAATPPVVLTMTARFHRLSWRFEGPAYALALMDAGVLMQTLYLVCTAMRLAPCAVGTIRADAAAQALDTDWRVEPGIAQFAIGRDPGTRGERAGRLSPVNDAQWHERACGRVFGEGG
jgi:SagB-type dehydrogenase family enzyme